MTVSLSSILTFAALVSLFSANTCTDELPGMQITNWHDSVLRFRANQKTLSESSSTQIPGPYEYRIGDDYSVASISSDSFAVSTTSTVYNDPTKWNTHSEVNRTGVYETTILDYDSKSLDLSITIQYEFAPYYPFYLVRYNLTNTGSSDISGYLMDAVGLDSSASPSTTFTNDDAYGPYSTVDMTGDSTYTFGHGLHSYDSSFTASSASYYAGSDTYSKFSTSGLSSNVSSCTDANQTLGISVPFTIAAESSAVITFYRTFRASTTGYQKAVKLAHAKTVEQIYAAGTREYNAFYRRGKQLKTGTKVQKTFFNNSLLFMKNAINPTTGAIVGNFHPDLIDQARPSEGCLIALALAEAGYHYEAGNYFEWLSQRDFVTTDNVTYNGENANIFASAYFFWNSSVDTSVTGPHLDSLGLFMMGCYYMYIHTDLRDRLRNMDEAMFNITMALQAVGGYDKLFPADIHPNGLAGTTRTYNAWTQAFAYSGLMMASKIQKYWYLNETYAETLRRRGLRLHANITEYFNASDADVDSTTTNGLRLYGYLTPQYSSGSETQPRGADISDATSFAFYFLGLQGAPSSSSTYIQIPPIKTAYAKNHHDYVIETLLPENETNTTLARISIARYENDTEYSGEFASNDSYSAAPTATIYALWAEHALGLRANHALRLNWLAKISDGTTDYTHGEQPVGKAVSYYDNQLAWEDAPDVVGHSALYVWTFLMTERQACMINPLSWASDGVL